MLRRVNSCDVKFCEQETKKENAQPDYPVGFEVRNIQSDITSEVHKVNNINTFANSFHLN